MTTFNNSLSIVDVSLSKIEKNYKHIKSFFGVKNLAGVLKSNAYGLGAKAVSEALSRAGCSEFYVATIDEAMLLRQTNPEAKIYALHGINKGEEYYFLENKIVPVLVSIEQMELWSNLAEKLETKLPANVFFDTGMVRLGIMDPEQDKAEEIIKKDAIDVDYIMSHISCGKIPDHELNNLQLNRFYEISNKFPEIKTSFSNSYGLHISDAFAQFDQARVGVDLYGVRDGPRDIKTETEVAFSIYTHIIQIHHIEKDEFIGYNATAKVTKGMKVATIPVGYADSYFFNNSTKLPFAIAGHKVYPIGAVSMDLITLDVSAVPDEKLFTGQRVEIMGQHISVETVSEMTNTSSYGIITSLGQRFKRNYVD